MMNFTDKSHLRRTVLAFLYDNPNTAPHPAAAIALHLREARAVLCRFEPDDVQQTMDFLVGMGLAFEHRDPLGAGKTYSLTADGILFHERNS